MKYRLFDTQWINVVNNIKVLDAMDDVELAVAIVVRLTEEAMAKNIETNNWPPHDEVDVVDVVASTLNTNRPYACELMRRALGDIYD